MYRACRVCTYMLVSIRVSQYWSAMWGLRFTLMLSVVKYLEGMPFNPMGGGFPHIDMFEVQVAPDRIVNVTVDRFREVADTNRSAYNKILDILNVTSTNYSYNPLLKGLEEGVETVVEASLKDSTRPSLNNNTSSDQWETWGHTVQGTYIATGEVQYSTYTVSQYR